MTISSTLAPGNGILIGVTYVRDLNGHDADVFRHALKPGGFVVYENSASPDNGVLQAFLGFQIVRFEDVEAISDWNRVAKHRVQKMIARLP